jgi:hypothetical protein
MHYMYAAKRGIATSGEYFESQPTSYVCQDEENIGFLLPRNIGTIETD